MLWRAGEPPEDPGGRGAQAQQPHNSSLCSHKAAEAVTTPSYWCHPQSWPWLSEHWGWHQWLGGEIVAMGNNRDDGLRSLGQSAKSAPRNSASSCKSNPQLPLAAAPHPANILLGCTTSWRALVSGQDKQCCVCSSASCASMRSIPVGILVFLSFFTSHGDDKMPGEGACILICGYASERMLDWLHSPLTGGNPPSCWRGLPSTVFKIPGL